MKIKSNPIKTDEKAFNEWCKQIQPASNMIGGSYDLLRIGTVKQVSNYIKGCELFPKRVWLIQKIVRNTLMRAGRTENRAKWYVQLILWLSLPKNHSILEQVAHNKIGVVEAYAQCKGETTKKKSSVNQGRMWLKKALAVFKENEYGDVDVMLEVIQLQQQRNQNANTGTN
jgi:hypothetical protein